MANEGKLKWNGIYYIDYIPINPLYIHNHIQYYENTVNNFDRLGYDPVNLSKQMAIEYIDTLKRKEDNIFSGINDPDKALKAMVQDAYGSEETINKIIDLLDKAFYIDNINSKVYVATGKGGKIFFKILGINPYTGEKINISQEIKSIGKNKHGHNIYNYKLEIEKAEKEFGNFYKNQLKDIVKQINEAIGNENKYLKELKKLLSESEIKRSINDETSNFRQYLKMVSDLNNPEKSADELMKFLIDRLGKYRAIRGAFSEGAKIFFKNTTEAYFYDNLSSDKMNKLKNERVGDELGKTDLIIYGGKIKKINPITISRKVTKVRDRIKFHTSSLENIYRALQNEDERIANIYLYIMLNNPYSGSEKTRKAMDIVKLINRYMSYLFLSGTSRGNGSDQALYLAITGPDSNGKSVTHFIRFSDILKSIVGLYGEEEKDNIKLSLTNTRKSTQDIFPLWMEKVFYIQDLKEKSGKAKMNYFYLGTSSRIKSAARSIAGSLLTKERQFTVDYDSIERIALNHGII